MKPKHAARETWLQALVEAMRVDFVAFGMPLPAKIRVGCGWPSSRALTQKSRTLGEYWSPRVARDGSVNIVVTLAIDDSMKVAGILLHELCHAATPGCGHRGHFARATKFIGLKGNPRFAHEPEPALEKRLNRFIKAHGKYPHGSVDISKEPKQTTRMVKLECSECGYIVRTTAKWLQYGLPECYCGGTFEV